MSSLVETMMYVGRVPWHGDGEYVGEDAILSDEAMRRSKLDWRVDKKPLFTYVDGEAIEIPSRKALVRDSDNRVLSLISNRYSEIQNETSFKFMDSLVGEGLMRYHTAGSLDGGKRVWLLGKVGQSEIVPGDTVDHFLFLHNGHDGKHGLRVLWTDVRVVCANTARAALSKGAKSGVSIRHRGDVMAKLSDAQEVLGLANEAFDESANFMRGLAETPMTARTWVDLCLELVPEPATDENGDFSKRAMTRVNNERSALTELFLGGTGTDIPGVAGTAWGAYNAITEYASYYRGNKTSASKRFGSLMLGAGNDFVQTGTSFLRELAA